MTLGDVLASMAGVVMEGADPPRCACTWPDDCDGSEVLRCEWDHDGRDPTGQDDCDCRVHACQGRLPCPGCRRCVDGPWLDDLPAEDLPR